jgi:hypothetical protein
MGVHVQGDGPGSVTQVYHFAAVLLIGASSCGYASIHGVTRWAFVRIDLSHCYMHIRFMSNHFVSQIIAHQLFLVECFSL